MRALWLAIALIGCTKEAAPARREPPAQSSRALRFEVDAWWGEGAPKSLASLRGCVVMVRFFTDTCPYCRRSMPTIQKLADELADEPVRFVGLYHPKPRGRDSTWDEAITAAKTWGITFPIGYDRAWKTLDAWWLDAEWLDAGSQRATSASFVFDAKGAVVHVHPGPELSSQPDAGGPYTDFVAVRTAIERALPAATGC